MEPEIPSLQLLAPVATTPEAVPTDFAVAMRSGGGANIIMQVGTPQGVQFFFMDAACAAQVAEMLANAARQARSSIVVVPSGVRLPARPPAV